MSAYRRYLVVIVATVSLLALGDAVLLPGSNISIGMETVSELVNGASLGVAFIVLARLLQLAGRRSRGILHDVLDRVSNGVELAGIWLTLFFIFAVAGCLFMYLVSATDRPLMDGALAAIDRSLGFDWPRVVEAANAYPALARVLVLAYWSITFQIQLTALFYILAGNRDRLFEFAATLVVAFLMTMLMAMAVPTSGAYSYYGIPPSSYDHFTAVGGFEHLDTLQMLRSGKPIEYVQGQSLGMISFPSFHTALALLVIFAFRRSMLFVPVVLLNIVMLTATIPEGGHHLIDVIAGAAIAVIACLFTARVARGTRRENEVLITQP